MMRRASAVLLAVACAGHAMASAAQDTTRTSVALPRFFQQSSDADGRSTPLDPAKLPALTKRISLDLRSATRAEVLRVISRASGVEFVYATDLLPAGSVSLVGDTFTVRSALDASLLATNVDVVITSAGSAVLVRRASDGPGPLRGAATVYVRLQEEATQMPLAGAIVVLLRDSRVVAQALSGDSGRAVFRVPEPGTYQLRVHRIGYQALLTDPFALSPGQSLKREISMTSVRTLLPAVTVRALSRCDAGDTDGELAVALWEQIRLALTANVLTQQQWAVPLHVTDFRRDVTLDGTIERERTLRSRVVRGPAFGAFAAEVLSKRGYAYLSANGDLSFAAPDAASLLSDAFVNTHCFRAVAGTNATVGLMFEPISDVELPDVRGTLWVNRATSELQSLEYRYTGLWRDLETYDLGGRLEFSKAPSGAWIVNYWYIRMPRVRPRMTQNPIFRNRLPREVNLDLDLAGYFDEGGRVKFANATPAGTEGGVLRGRVFDSTTAHGLAGAMVHVEGQADSVVTDEEGRYEIDVRVPGAHRVLVQHEHLGLLNDSTSKGFVLNAGDSAAVNFAAPSLATFVRQLCGAAKSRSGFIGVVVDAQGTGTEGADVRARWSLAANGSHEEYARSGRRGVFALCDIPVATAVGLHVAGPTGVSIQANARLTEQKYDWLELRPAAP
ncbi:MAG: carboxypeptidase regulatory-like domain-containing protein [bacterium]